MSPHPNTRQQGGRLTPKALIRAYSEPRPQFMWRTEARKHSQFYEGPCGFDGRRGYDDGYDWMEALEAAGWLTIGTLGEMPFSIYLNWPALPADPRHAIAHYSEGTLSLEIFHARALAENAVKQMHRGHPAA
jgi:hypothetical protein